MNSTPKRKLRGECWAVFFNRKLFHIPSNEREGKEMADDWNDSYRYHHSLCETTRRPRFTAREIKWEVVDE